MTSANVIEYRIFFLDTQVGKHYQHLLCKSKAHQLLRFNPPEMFDIQAYGEDEEEEYWESEPINLRTFLNKIDLGRVHRNTHEF